MRIVPLEPWHLERLTLQPAQAMMAPEIAASEYRATLARHEGYTGMDGDAVIGSAGVVPAGAHRAVAWALLSCTGPRRFLEVHRAVAYFLDAVPYRRIETWVLPDHEQGHRWARLLGFHAEGCMEAYLPDGGDAWLYARVK